MHVIATQLLLVALVYIIAYAYSIEFATRVDKCDEDWCKSVTAAHRKCAVGCTDTTRPLVAYPARGRNYYIGTGSADDCLVTFWTLSHFVLYFVLGFIAPSLFWPTFAIGVGFELYEYHKFDCHDVLDIAANSVGFLAGSTVAANLYPSSE